MTRSSGSSGDRGSSTGSGLIIPFPVADPIVGDFRSTLDPSAAVGVPAHVTVHFPWIPLGLVDELVLTEVAEIAAGFPSFDVSFSQIRWFKS